MQKPAGMDESSLTDIEREGLKRSAAFWATGGAYALEHATRPSTSGIVLASNPVALLAWSVVQHQLVAEMRPLTIA